MEQKLFLDHFKNYFNIFKIWQRGSDSEIYKSRTTSRIGFFSSLLHKKLFRIKVRLVPIYTMKYGCLEVWLHTFSMSALGREK